jgi:hypothetical protein
LEFIFCYNSKLYYIQNIIRMGVPYHESFPAPPQKQKQPPDSMAIPADMFGETTLKSIEPESAAVTNALIEAFDKRNGTDVKPGLTAVPLTSNGHGINPYCTKPSGIVMLNRHENRKSPRHSGQRFLLSLRGPPDPEISVTYWIPRSDVSASAGMTGCG